MDKNGTAEVAAGEAPEVELARLRRENAALRQRDAELVGYLRLKIDQLLMVIGTLPLRAEELDEDELVAFDPITIIADTFTQILQTQRQTNLQLKAAHDKIDAIFNAVGAGIVVLDRKHHILSFNKRLKELFFPGKRQILGRTCISLMCQTVTPPTGCVFAKVMASGLRERTREWLFEDRFYDVVGMPVKDRRGVVQQVVIVYHEVTERKWAEQELCHALEQAHEAREHTEAIVRSINEGMLVVDASGTLLLANPAAVQMLRVKNRELVGKSLTEVCFRTELAARVALACASDEAGEPFDLSVTFSDSKHPSLFQARLALLHTSSGKVRGAVVTLREVTRERELERMKSEFVSTAAHELRTPLTSILGFSELLLDAEAFSPAERSEFVNLIHHKAEDLSALIDELLDISRIEAGHNIPLMREAVSLETLAHAAVDFFRHSSPPHKFDLQLPPQPVVVFADPRRIAQVFDNLLSNAVKYSPAGGLVTVRLAPEGDHCTVAVSDTGIGMTEEQVKCMFDKFYRADSSNTAVQGTGLGMTIVKQLIDSHGGMVSVQSAPGQGTTVSFTLPLWVGESD